MLELDEMLSVRLKELEVAAKAKAEEQTQEEKSTQAEDDSGSCLFILDFGARNPVADFALLSRQTVVAASWDGRLRCLDLKSRGCTNIVEIKPQVKLTCVCAPAPGLQIGTTDIIYVGLEDGTVACWNLASTCKSSSYLNISWNAHAAEVTKLQSIMYTGKHTDVPKRWLVSSSEDRTIRLWNPEEGKLLKEFWGHQGGVLMLCYVPWQHLLWSGSRDHSIRSWCFEDSAQQLRETEAMEKADAESRRAAYIYAKMRNAHKGSKKKTGKKDGSPSSKSKKPKSRSPNGKKGKA